MKYDFLSRNSSRNSSVKDSETNSESKGSETKSGSKAGDGELRQRDSVMKKLRRASSNRPRLPSFKSWPINRKGKGPMKYKDDAKSILTIDTSNIRGLRDRDSTFFSDSGDEDTDLGSIYYPFTSTTPLSPLSLKASPSESSKSKYFDLRLSSSAPTAAESNPLKTLISQTRKYSRGVLSSPEVRAAYNTASNVILVLNNILSCLNEPPLIEHDYLHKCRRCLQRRLNVLNRIDHDRDRALRKRLQAEIRNHPEPEPPLCSYQNRCLQCPRCPKMWETEYRESGGVPSKLSCDGIQHIAPSHRALFRYLKAGLERVESERTLLYTRKGLNYWVGDAWKADWGWVNERDIKSPWWWEDGWSGYEVGWLLYKLGGKLEIGHKDEIATMLIDGRTYDEPWKF